MQVFIIGYGNQAKAWAFNLRDSGCEVIVVLKVGSPSRVQAIEHFPVISQGELPPENPLIALLTPDDTHHSIVKDLSKQMSEATIIYAHGHSNFRHKLSKKYPQFTHLLFAPKGIASAVRKHYLQKLPLAAVYSVEFSAQPQKDQAMLKHLAKNLGIDNLYQCTFEQETKADLFSEQSILCSVLPYAANLSFKKLRQEGIPAELAYLECWYEIKLIADAMVALGPNKFFELISPNALYGSQLGKEALLGAAFEKPLEGLYTNINNGTFDEQAADVDIKRLRETIQKFWSDQELSSVHEKLQSSLFKENT